jgi:Bacteriophage HK97-gp10, putative tail-component
MSRATFTIEGLPELRAWFAALPQDVRDDGRVIVHTAAQQAYDRVYTQLPVRTGYLRSQLAVVGGDPSPTEALAYLTNRAPYAHFVEHGTHDTPPVHVFVPETHRQEAAMWLALAAMVEHKGLEVTGSAEA